MPAPTFCVGTKNVSIQSAQHNPRYKRRDHLGVKERADRLVSGGNPRRRDRRARARRRSRHGARRIPLLDCPRRPLPTVRHRDHARVRAAPRTCRGRRRVRRRPTRRSRNRRARPRRGRSPSRGSIARVFRPRASTRVDARTPRRAARSPRRRRRGRATPGRQGRAVAFWYHIAMATTLRLQAATTDALRAEASRSGRSQQQVIRDALEQYLAAANDRREAAPPSGIDTLGGLIRPARRPFGTTELSPLTLRAGESTADLLDRDDRF